MPKEPKGHWEVSYNSMVFVPDEENEVKERETIEIVPRYEVLGLYPSCWVYDSTLLEQVEPELIRRWFLGVAENAREKLRKEVLDRVSRQAPRREMRRLKSKQIDLVDRIEAFQQALHNIKYLEDE